MNAFSFGPFDFEPCERITLAGQAKQRWQMGYGGREIAETMLPDPASAEQITEAFAEHRAAFIAAAQPDRKAANADGGYSCALVTSTEFTGEAGKTLGRFTAHAPIPGISSGLIDDRHPTWAITPHGSCPMLPAEFERLAEAHAAIDSAARASRSPPAHENAWVANLLPAEVLASQPSDWRAPTSWEIRHVVGEGSFTRFSGAKAAALVGVTPQNFRKYTARDGASTRQSISFAMWHLLLHKLGVQSAEVAA